MRYKITEEQLETLLEKKKAYNHGFKSNTESNGVETNPYEKGTTEYGLWVDGWCASEAKKQDDGDNQVKMEIGEDVENTPVKKEKENIFTIELKSPSINIEIEDGVLFKQSPIMVGDVAYDFTINPILATPKYSIDVNFNRSGIDSITLEPISLSIMGTLELENEEFNKFDKEFELQYALSGLTKNTLSGSLIVDGTEIKLEPLRSNVKFNTDKTNQSNSYSVTSVNLYITNNGTEIIFEY
jgi:hypothetical protein